MIPMMFAYYALALGRSLGILAVAAPSTAGCNLLPSSISSTIIADSTWYCPIAAQINAQWSQYLPLMTIAVIMSFMVAAVIFMVGAALRSNRIRNFGIAEVYESVATALIVLGFMYVTSVLFGILPGLYLGNINPYATAFHLITTTIQQAENVYGNIYYVYIGLATLTSVRISLSGTASGLIGISGLLSQTIVNTFSVITSILFLNPATALSRFLVEGITLLYGEYYLLVFFSIASVPAFLVPGVIFRAFLPTRALGGVMIAMGIGFYLVAPTLFAATYYFTAPGVVDSLSSASAQFGSVVGTSLPKDAASSPSSPIVVDLSNLNAALSGFWMLILFYPAFIAAVTYSFIQETSKLLAGTYSGSARIRGFI